MVVLFICRLGSIIFNIMQRVFPLFNKSTKHVVFDIICLCMYRKTSDFLLFGCMFSQVCSFSFIFTQLGLLR